MEYLQQYMDLFSQVSWLIVFLFQNFIFATTNENRKFSLYSKYIMKMEPPPPWFGHLW